MAVSLCSNPIFLRPRPMALPAKFAGANMRPNYLNLRTFPLLITAKAFSSQKYVYPDPIPEFAAAETERFKAELLKKLSNERETFGNELQAVVNLCAEIFCEFLHEDYGGPGTLLIEPFTDMMVALTENNLPGAPLAARASLLWAQNYVDQHWEDWNSKQK